MSKTIFCKLLQRKTYDILSKKYTGIFLFLGLLLLFVCTLHLGETVIEWSKEKYSVVFSPYSDNIVGNSYRSMLCQYVPIDVVYTWVNGSDPKFLKELVTAKEDYGFMGHDKNCSFSSCVKSHMLLVRPELPFYISMGDLEEISPVFQNIEKTFVVSSQLKKENITVLVFPDIAIAEEVLAMRSIQIDSKNYSLSAAYLTDNWSSQHTVLLDSMFVLSPVPSYLSKEDILLKMPSDIKQYVSKVQIDSEKSLAYFVLSNVTAVNSALMLSNLTFQHKVAAISSVYLVVQVPSDHEDISASRFTDNEELRYSLRSLEKHAPWVRHIYIVTNGQIPYWLNLDNTRISIVTHYDIFPNRSHLPTFSSPAIECHLHRIPNLSDKFLYLNDDVLFGKNVWPEDFYTHTKGQKVYLSWPVPNCAEGCPSSWIRDGYCDKPCNNSQCQWDGGDCTNDNPMLPFQNNHHDTGITSFLHTRASNKAYCNSECADTWLADRYCDKACNVRACGFDAGDCGLENFMRLQQLDLSIKQSQYYLPKGEHVGFINLTNFLASNYTLTEGSYEDNPVVRSLAISLKYSVIAIVLHPNHNKTNLTLKLKGEYSLKPFEKTIHLIVDTRLPKESSSEALPGAVVPATLETFTFEEFSESMRSPKILTYNHMTSSNLSFENVNVSASNLPIELVVSLQELKKLLDEDIITYKAFKRKKSELIYKHFNRLNSTEQKFLKLVRTVDDVATSSEHVLIRSSSSSPAVEKELTLVVSQPSPNNDSASISPAVESNQLEKHQEGNQQVNRDMNPQISRLIMPRMLKGMPSPPSLIDFFKSLKNIPSKQTKPRELTPSPVNPTRRHLLDTFGDSLRHVNKLYNEVFGYEARKVPSHIAHFVDRNVMSRLTQEFDSAFDVTSSHKIRSSNDMQFAFSYYYYLMSEMESVDVADIFRSFDVDNSGTWSDREIRTVLTRLYDIPLGFDTVAGFEQIVVNCTHQPSLPPVTLNENEYGSKLPQVTESLVELCPELSSLLITHFGIRKRNAYEILGEEEVAFKMIHNNLTQVLIQIDDLRKHPRKFVCLNDNMKHGTQEAEVIRAVIQDFYESLFPTRSQFELTADYRNRFLYVDELKEWRKTRDLIRVITYSTLALLIIFSVISFIKAETRTFERHLRVRTLQNRHFNPHCV